MADELVQLSTVVASLKSEERLEELKKRFFHETIRLKLEPHPPDHADARWRIERFRLNPDFIQRLIDGAVSTRGVTLAYLKPCNNNTSNSNSAGITGNSNSGVGIIVPNEMQMLCQKKTIYQMVLSYPNKTKDVQAKSQNAYMGEMQFILRNVPIFSQNYLHRVQSDHVKAWIQDSILKEDPHLTQLENKVKALRRDLQSIVEKLKRLPNEMVMNERNVEMKGERAEKIRREKYNQLRDSKFRFKADLGLVHNQVQEMKIEKLSQIELTTQCTEKSGVDCYDWAVQLYGNNREFNEEILLNKDSWNTSFMYAIPNDTTDNIKSEKDTSTRTSGTDETEYLVDTASISVERVEHGFGIYHRPSNYEYDEDSKEVCPNNHVDAYHGTYADGRYQGFGMIYTTCYIYGGGFEKHNLHGKGILMYKDGDLIESDFGIPPTIISNASNGDDTIQIETPARKDYCTSNRYARGQPICSTNGNTKITFCDGFYEGETKNGTLSGKGVYTTITGDRMEGEFVDGILIQGTIKKSNGDLLSGTFKDGLLHGKGSLSSSLKRSKYTGYFVDGEKHGTGKEIFYKRTKASSTRKKDIILATYSGCFCNNERSGLGTFEFQDTGFTFINAVKDDLLLDGPWLRGNPRAGGKVTNSNYCSSTPTTNRSSTRNKFLNRFKRVEDHKEAIAGSELQEIARVESRFRTMVESKKKNIFDFHRKKVIKTRTHSVASNAIKLDPKSKETEGIRASSVNSSVRNNTYHHHPTSSRIRVDSNAALTSKHKTVRSTSKHVETLWLEMESTFERFQSVMDPVQQEYNSLGDKWEGIHLDTLRERASADREK